MPRGGYFSEPQDGLDPNIFSGRDIKIDVRSQLLETLYSGLEEIGFKYPWEWVYAWLAGSGATRQYGNGDLDVLFGADLTQFLRSNPQFPKLSLPEVATYVDEILKQTLWPKTRNYKIGSGHYEVTFYWNPTTGKSIENVHPYAAIDLLNGKWVVEPPQVSKDPHTMYPREWYDFTDADYRQAVYLDDLHANGGTLGKVQARTAARQLWESIHGGRRVAFSEQGQGYGDYHNFRWQRGKETGTVQILRDIVSAADEADALSGIARPQDIITRAAIRYAGERYWT